MNTNREIAYRLDPSRWVEDVFGLTLTSWQKTFLLAPLGSSSLVLTARQVGKTTVAACAMAHSAVFISGSLSIVACPSQRQSAEAVRKVRDMLLRAGAKLSSDNVYGLELANGSRVLALPGSDDSVRGLTVDAWIVADEAARLSPELISALRPMRARRPNARLTMLSTAWSRTDPFWSAWESGGQWIRIQATVDQDPTMFPPEFLAEEKANLGEEGYKREYLGIPSGGQVSPFTWEMYQHSTERPLPLHILEFPKPVIIAHDVGCTKDRSTAVVGGRCSLMPEILGIKQSEELQQGLCGSARATALALVDQRYSYKTLIIADLSFDPTYAETLFERFGRRVIGLQIGATGDGLVADPLQISNNTMLRYRVGRTYLLDFLLRELQNDKVQILPGEASVRAYEQLMALEMEIKQNGIRYKCLSGRHDDLAMSWAMLAWASKHPHLPAWCRPLEPQVARNRCPAPSSAGWT